MSQSKEWQINDPTYYFNKHSKSVMGKQKREREIITKEDIGWMMYKDEALRFTD